MTLSAAEIESVRFHLGWGNISVAAQPYTPDGFYEVFNNIVSPYLSTSTETTAATAVTANTTTVVTPAAMTLITVGTQLVVDVGEAAEIVMVAATAPTTFTAAFTKAHATSGYPVLVMCGKARLRYLLYRADTAWTKMQSSGVAGSMGIKQLGQGEIEWFAPDAVYQGVLTQYLGILAQISSLVRVPINDETRGRPSRTLEVY